MTETATRVSAHPDAEKYLGPNSDIVKSDLEMLELLASTFSAPMTAWRSQALQSASALASYYNLGAFAQSSRSGITKVSFSVPGGTSNSECVVAEQVSWTFLVFHLCES